MFARGGPGGHVYIDDGCCAAEKYSVMKSELAGGWRSRHASAVERTPATTSVHARRGERVEAITPDIGRKEAGSLFLTETCRKRLPPPFRLRLVVLQSGNGTRVASIREMSESIRLNWHVPEIPAVGRRQHKGRYAGRNASRVRSGRAAPFVAPGRARPQFVLLSVLAVAVPPRASSLLLSLNPTVSVTVENSKMFRRAVGTRQTSFSKRRPSIASSRRSSDR